VFGLSDYYAKLNILKSLLTFKYRQTAVTLGNVFYKSNLSLTRLKATNTIAIDSSGEAGAGIAHSFSSYPTQLFTSANSLTGVVY